MGDVINIHLEDRGLVDLTFLHGRHSPTLSILCRDNRSNTKLNLKTYKIDIQRKELKLDQPTLLNVDRNSYKIMSVPAPICGVVLFNTGSIMYLDSGAITKQVVAIAECRITTYALIEQDARGARFLLSDDSGTLYVLTLHLGDSVANGEVSHITLDIIGDTSLASALNYLGDGVLFVASGLANSQLLRLRDTEDEDGNFLEVMDLYDNAGPILDMCVTASERQGQSRVVTCSGGLKGGALRVIRSGISIEEQVRMLGPPSGGGGRHMNSTI